MVAAPSSKGPYQYFTSSIEPKYAWAPCLHPTITYNNPCDIHGYTRINGNPNHMTFHLFTNQIFFHSSFETHILPTPTFLKKLLDSVPINSKQQTPILVIKTKCLTRQTIATHASIYSSTVHALDIVSHLVGNVTPCLPIETHTVGRRTFHSQGTVDAEAT